MAPAGEGEASSPCPTRSERRRRAQLARGARPGRRVATVAVDTGLNASRAICSRADNAPRHSPGCHRLWCALAGSKDPAYEEIRPAVVQVVSWTSSC